MHSFRHVHIKFTLSRVACIGRRGFPTARASSPLTIVHARFFQSASPTSQSSRFRFRFRPIPAFAALLLAQFILLWDVSRRTELFETGDSGKFLSSSAFLPYTILHKHVVSPNSCILTLRPGSYTGPIEDYKGSTLDAWRYRINQGRGKPPVLTKQDLENLRNYQDSLWQKGVWSIEVKQPHMSITRRYTPLPPDITSSQPNSTIPSPHGTSHTDAGIFRLFIRREPHGEVSRYLYDLPEGDIVEIRGGFPEFQIPDDVEQVTFVAGGTGIAPALAAAYSIALKQVDASMQILWANRRREDCTGGYNPQPPSASGLTSLLRKINLVAQQQSSNMEASHAEQPAVIVKQLENWRQNMPSFTKAHQSHLSTRYFVDEEGSIIREHDLTQSLLSRADSQPGQVSGRRLVLVSGPDGFVDHIVGRNFRADRPNSHQHRGPNNGLLSKVDLSGWEVWKL